MDDNKRKPQTYQQFEQLTRKLMSVPKSELDKQMKLYDKKKSTKRKPSD